MKPSLLLVLTSCILFANLLPAREHPNVVIFMTDDQGWGDLSFHGNTDLATPHIDSLARDGARFDSFYACAVCSPTRAEFLTGRYHPRGGVSDTSKGAERLDLDEYTIANAFQNAGYATGAFGKWHNGMQYPYHPNGRGFDEYYGFASGHWGNYFSPMLEHNGKIVKGEGYIVDDFTNKAIAFIRKHQNQPFFAFLPYNTPHGPMMVPDEYWDRFKDKTFELQNRDPELEIDAHKRAALAMCENIDDNVGRLLATLDELDLARDTIVVYLHDNGPNGWRWNGGMRGRKGSTDEGGVRSPLFLRYPAKIPAGHEVTQIGAAIDLLPTLTELAGIPMESPNPLDGRSLAPLILNDAETAAGWADRTIFSFWNGRLSARTQQFRLDNDGRLYDIQTDRGQTVDVADQFPDVANRLRAEAQHFRDTVAADWKRDDRPFLVGHPDFAYNQLPARDALTRGGIKRSNRWPNCSFYLNWTSTDDAIYWPVEVVADGRFRAEVYYACPKPDVGSTFELSLGDSTLKGRITEAHDPPPLGLEFNRTPMRVSVSKDFRPLDLGIIELKKGSGDLTLRATEIPGSQVMEFRLIMLTRLPD